MVKLSCDDGYVYQVDGTAVTRTADETEAPPDAASIHVARECGPQAAFVAAASIVSAASLKSEPPAAFVAAAALVSQSSVRHEPPAAFVAAASLVSNASLRA